MSVYKSLLDFSIDDETFEIFESVSSIVNDVPWKVCISSPIQEILLKECCFPSYEAKIQTELAKNSTIKGFSTSQVKCKVSDHGFSLKIILDKKPVLHCLFLGLDELPLDENNQRVINTRSRRRYKPFTLLLIHGKKIYEKTMIPFIEKLLSCNVTKLLLSIRDYHWILTLTTHYINSSSVIDNTLHFVNKYPSSSSMKQKLIMRVDFEKILAVWNDIFNKYKTDSSTISSVMSEKFKTTIQEHLKNIYSLDMSKLSLSEIHVEDIMKVQVSLQSPVICLENSEVTPVILYFLYQMSCNQQSW